MGRTSPVNESLPNVLIRPLVEFFLWMSGVHPQEARDAGEQRRYASLGALIAFMFVWSTIAMGHALASAVQSKSTWVAIAFGAGWATLLTILDRILVGMPLMKDGILYRFFQVFFIRGALAVVGSFVTAVMAMLFIFHADIAALEAQNLATTSSLITGPAMKTQPVLTAKQAIKDDNTRLATLANAVTHARSQVSADQRQIACEASGTCGTKVPDDLNHIGWATKLDIQKEQADQADLSAAIANENLQRPLIQKDIQTQNQLIQGVVAKASATAGAQQTGIQAQTNALRSLIKTEWTMKLWVVLIIAIDLSVITIKAFLPASRVDRMHRDRFDQEEATRAAYASSMERDQVIATAVARKAERVDALDRLDHARELSRIAKAEAAISTTDTNDGRTAPSDRTQRPVRLKAAGAATLVLISFAILGLHRFEHTPPNHGSAGATTQRTPMASPTTSAIRPAAFAGRKLPVPSNGQAMAARAFLKTSSGQPLLSLHRATAGVVVNYSRVTCNAAHDLLRDPGLNLQAASSVPDAVLSELSLDEVHDVASLKACPAVVKSSILPHLAALDALIAQRLKQDGVPV